MDALRFKYASDPPGQDGNGESQGDESLLYSNERAIKISGKTAEEVGFDKIRKRLADLHELRIVILDNLDIQRSNVESYRRAWESWRPETPHNDPLQYHGRNLDVNQACPNVSELDVSRNLFEGWLEVASICEELRELRSVRCDGNRFRSTDMNEREVQYFTSAFRKIQSLSLADTLLPWIELCSIARTFRSINTFIASSNQLHQLDSSLLPSSMITLVMESNEFESLSDIFPISKLPQLRKLVLRRNKVASISRSSSGPPPVFQDSLKELDLSRNNINSWAFINNLHTTFPGLTSLRILGNPLYGSLRSPDGKPLTADDGHILTIARLPQLKSLNYSTISAKDRLNAETYYLSQIALELSLALSASAREEREIIKRHPRWKELCEEYGEPAIVSKSAALDSNALSSRLIKIRLKIGLSASPHVDESLIKNTTGTEGAVISAPKRYSIYTVQGLVGRRLGIPPPQVKLIWETGEPDIVAVQEEASFEPWDSDVEDEQPMQAAQTSAKMREVELAAGTRPISTWVDGDDVLIRVEMS